MLGIYFSQEVPHRELRVRNFVVLHVQDVGVGGWVQAQAQSSMGVEDFPSPRATGLSLTTRSRNRRDNRNRNRNRNRWDRNESGLDGKS
jgi:hypothetical protein